MKIDTTDPQIFMVGFPNTSTSTTVEYYYHFKLLYERAMLKLPEKERELTYRELYDEPGDLP